MNSIKTYLEGLGRTTRVLVLALAVVVVGAGIAQAATTISTNISTEGTLSVTDLATFLGGATTTQLTLGMSDTIKNTSASSTALSGSLTVGGGTGSATLTVTNSASATSTVTAGCVVTTATSSATPIRLLFNTQATTTSINGNTVQGVVLWSYGSACTN